ncbi:MAG: DNA-processing protein DprA [Pseudomonadota bacterium]
MTSINESVWLQGERHTVVARQHGDYPPLLQEIAKPPHLLYVDGEPATLTLPAIAIVGSRNPTRAGEQNAFAIARKLAAAGFCIASGLAQGIDAAAHRGALDAGGTTVAFLGHGIDRLYPARNRQLAQEISASGALVSEFPVGMPPNRAAFPQRNRLIAGIALGTLVVEAARSSGSLITARFAGDQGREVFALPGSIHNPLTRGCHELIRQGAKLVETAADIVSEVAPLTGCLVQIAVESTSKASNIKSLDNEYVQLKNRIGHDPITVDELARNCGLTIEKVSSMLLLLELHGEVESLSGGRYSALS